MSKQGRHGRTQQPHMRLRQLSTGREQAPCVHPRSRPFLAWR